MRFIFMLAIFVMPTVKAEVVEIPTTFKTAEAKPVLKCENGSCWVYHGTSIHVDFSGARAEAQYTGASRATGTSGAAGVSGYCASCQRSVAKESFTTEPVCSSCSRSFRSDTYYGKPCLIARQ